MTWGFRAQRGADDFDTLVEQLSTGGSTSTDPRSAELLELVGALRSVPDPQPRPEFVADLRGRLMAEAETALVPTDVSRLQLPARRTARERRIAAVVGGIAIVGASTSVAMASQSALPGESLYPIKRAIESAHAGLSVGEARKGDTELSNAAGRLDEVNALTRSDGLGSDERIAQTLSTFTSQATSAADLLLSDYAHTGRESSIVRLHDFASSSMDQLGALEPDIPYAARDELIAAASTISQIDAEASQQCPACGGTPIESIPLPLAGEQIQLPSSAPAAPTSHSTDRPGRGNGKGPDKGPAKGNGPQLPDVGDNVPPGSVQQPGSPGASSSPNAVQDLAAGLTSALTGKGGAGTGTSGSNPTSSPLGQVIDGVDEILHGVLDPITGELVPPGSTTTP
ncbi:DUF5667 domain-containing protein [Nocardioides conyzicola]|uniref:DUF5667 domain-containing protein n=1 Tax=Nocardioides conyzicola TaxID=1651781 RepID=A0ABP8X5N9_9ACTN